MVDGVMEAILMLLFLKSLRNGEREWIDDDAEDFDFLASLIADRETTQQRRFFGSKFGDGRISIIIVHLFPPECENQSCRTILTSSPISGFGMFLQ